MQNGQYQGSGVPQDLYFNVPTMVYFFDPASKTPDDQAEPIPLSINLYGTTSTGSSYGQNIPFVSVKFTEVQYAVSFDVSPAGAGITSPSGTQTFSHGPKAITAIHANGYRFSHWSSNSPYNTFDDPAQSSTNLNVESSGTVTAIFESVPPHFVDTANAIHDVNVGTHSSFPAMQAGPDSSFDTLTEQDSVEITGYGTGVNLPWFTGEDTHHEATLSIDGDTATYWSYSRSGEHYICFDLGQNYDITQIRLFQDIDVTKRWGHGSSIDVYIWYYDNNEIFDHKIFTWTTADAAAGWVDSPTFSASGRYIKLWEHGGDQRSHRMYEFNFKYVTTGCDLDLEAQFQNVVNYQYYTQLHIQTGTFAAGGENLRVDYWNGNSWATLGNLNSDTLNVFEVALTSPTYEIRFVGDQQLNDVHQSSWQIDYCALIAP